MKYQGFCEAVTDWLRETGLDAWAAEAVPTGQTLPYLTWQLPMPEVGQTEQGTIICWGNCLLEAMQKSRLVEALLPDRGVMIQSGGGTVVIYPGKMEMVSAEKAQARGCGVCMTVWVRGVRNWPC